MSYVEEGSGDPIVFLHGNPNLFLSLRNVIPFALHHGRCIAPDLIGMGDSEKLANSGPSSYTLREHRRYLDALLAYLEVNENVTSWSTIGALLSALTGPIAIVSRSRAWFIWNRSFIPLNGRTGPEVARQCIPGFRSPGGESMILEKNVFVKKCSLVR